MEKKVAIVTGAGSGIGFACAKALVQAGWSVYDFSRRDHPNPGVRHVKCDVSDEKQVADAVSAVTEEAGRIDLLVNNAGFGISGAIEFTRPEDIRRLLDVNLLGMDNMTRRVLPLMRKRKAGRIVNVSSVAAPLPVPFQAWYSASKAAITAYTLALRNEVAPFGIIVCAVLPGDIRTGFTAAREKQCEGDDIYGGRISRSVSAMEKDETGGLPPETAARVILRAATKKRPRAAYVVGIKYRAFVFLARFLPTTFVNAVEGKLYS